jgi:uncharacterized delta-60 repeat protein
MKLKKFYLTALFIFVLSLVFSSTVAAQLDPTFGTDGTATVDVLNNDTPIESYLLPDGKIFIISYSQISTDVYKHFFIRLNSDGTRDASYGTNGVREIQLPAGFPTQYFRFNAAVRQTDGKIVFVGADYVVRYNEDATLDTTFSGDGYHTPNVDQNGSESLVDVVQQTDGKIVVIGNVYNYSFGTNKVFLVRYETNGDLDLSFGDQSGFIINTLQYPIFSELFLQSNGKFLIIPSKNQIQGTYYPEGAIQRFNSDGTLDKSFSPVVFAGNNAIDKIRAFKLLSSDSFLVATNVSVTDDLLRTNTNMVFRRYAANGAPDNSFGTNGRTEIDVTSAMSDEAIAIGEQTDGKFVVAGVTNVEPNRTKILGLNLTMLRLNSNGSLDGKFLVTNLLSYFSDFTQRPLQYKSNIHIQPDGKILTLLTKDSENSGTDLFLTRTENVPLKEYRFHGMPYSFLNYYYSNASLYRPSNRNWYFSQSLYSVFFGLTQDVLAPADFYGDFRTDLAVFRPNEGTWYIARPNGIPDQDYITVRWGKAGDIPMPRDYNGDSKADIAVFRPTDGNWYIRNSTNNLLTVHSWGMVGDKPVAGDFDGDGFDDVAVWRPSTGIWYINKSSDNQTLIFNFGMEGDVPVQEDYDGDGKCDVAVWRPSTGTWYIYRSSDGGVTIFKWGLANDIPTPSDFDGDKKIDVAVWRPDTRNWFIYYSGSDSYAQFVFGLNADIPAQGRY